MADSRPLYLGPRLKRLRRELGLTQQVMADELQISASYIALLERNQRPLTADLLLRLARSYQLDVTALAGEDSADLAQQLSLIMRDPLFADIELPQLELADIAANFPAMAESMLRLHRAWQNDQRAFADQRLSQSEDQPGDPVDEVRRLLAAHGNHFPSLESRTEALSEEITNAGGTEVWLAKRGTKVRYLPGDVLMGALRRHDRHNSQLLINDGLDAASRAFHVAKHIIYATMRAELRTALEHEIFSSKAAGLLARSALAGYAAAALLMPYARFASAAEARKYDIIALSRLFGTSFEQTAHRLTTLSRPGSDYVDFFFVRIDAAGNVSKRLDGAGFPFSLHGGACPLWNVHRALRSPGEVLTQWLELPDGQRFFSIARSVIARGEGHGKEGITRAIALVCTADQADRLIYTRHDISSNPPPTPIGITCRLCHRAQCTARAAPPIGRDLLADDVMRASEPFRLTEE